MLSYMQLAQQAEGYVSIWVGNCDFDAVDEYVTTLYNLGDGGFERIVKEYVPKDLGRKIDIDIDVFNRFSYDFGVYFDEDLAELTVYTDSKQGCALFEGASYFESFADEIKKIKFDKEHNTAFLLYDVKYNGLKSQVRRDGVALDFLGSFRYQK